MENLNIKTILSIISREIYNWRRRNITPIGKIAVIKTLLLSKLNLILLILPNLSPSFITKIESLFYSYLWYDKPDKINRVTPTQNYSNGSLKMIDFKHFMSGLKLTWIQRIIIYPDSQWVKLLLLNIPHIMKISMLGTVYLNNTAKRTNNSFWSEILQSYVSFINKIHSKNQTDLLSTPIWYNEDINNGN